MKEKQSNIKFEKMMELLKEIKELEETLVHGNKIMENQFISPFIKDDLSYELSVNEELIEDKKIALKKIIEELSGENNE